MKELMVVLRITPDPDVVQDAKDSGASESDVIKEIKGHITAAIGNRHILDAGYIMDVEILTIEGEK